MGVFQISGKNNLGWWL